MATTGARITYSDVHARLQAEIKGSEGASTKTTTAVAGLTYRLLSKANPQTAKTYAESKLQEQVAKIQTLFAQYGPQTTEEPPRISRDTSNGLQAALSTIGLGIEKSNGPIQALTPSAQFNDTKAAFASSREFIDLTEIVSEEGAPAKFKHGAIQTELRLEIAKTAVLIEEFFSGLDDKTIQLEAAEVLDNVLKEVGLQLKKVDLPALREAEVIASPMMAAERVDASPSFNLLRDTANKLMQSDQVTYLDQQVVRQVVSPILKVVQHCVTRESDVFDLAKVEDDIEAATEDAKAYVRLAAKGKSTKEELTAQIQQDVNKLCEHATEFNHPIGLIGDLVTGYDKMLTIDKEDKEGLARLNLGDGQHYEITLANKHVQLTAAILKNTHDTITKYTNKGTENFDFKKFFADSKSEKDFDDSCDEFFLYLEHTAEELQLDPNRETLIKICDLPFKKALLISQKADEKLLRRSQKLPRFSEKQKASLAERKARMAASIAKATTDEASPSFISKHKGKLGTAAALTAAGLTAYATGGTSMLLA